MSVPRPLLAGLVLLALSGCTVVDVAGSAVGAAVDVTGAVVSTTVDVVTSPIRSDDKD